MYLRDTQVDIDKLIAIKRCSILKLLTNTTKGARHPCVLSSGEKLKG